MRSNNIFNPVSRQSVGGFFFIATRAAASHRSERNTSRVKVPFADLKVGDA